MGATSLVGFSSISFFNSFTNCAVTGRTSLGGDGSFRQRTGSENWPAIVGKAAGMLYIPHTQTHGRVEFIYDHSGSQLNSKDITYQ